MDKTFHEEPNLVNPELRQDRPPMVYSPFRTYDIEIWSQDDSLLNITAYPVMIDPEDNESISGTDYDSPFYSREYSIDLEDDHAEIDWWLCSYLSAPDWSGLDGMTEWQTYFGTDTFEAEAMGDKRPMPPSLRKWLDELPAYEPREGTN
jgi:hypothetical protein